MRINFSSMNLKSLWFLNNHRTKSINFLKSVTRSLVLPLVNKEEIITELNKAY